MSDKDWEELKNDLKDPEYTEQFITAAIYLVTEGKNDDQS